MTYKFFIVIQSMRHINVLRDVRVFPTELFSIRPNFKHAVSNQLTQK